MPITELGRELAHGDIVRFIRKGKIGAQNRRETTPSTYNALWIVTTPKIESRDDMFNGRVGVVGGVNTTELAFPREALEYVIGYVPSKWGIMNVERATMLKKHHGCGEDIE